MLLPVRVSSLLTIPIHREEISVPFYLEGAFLKKTASETAVPAYFGVVPVHGLSSIEFEVSNEETRRDSVPTRGKKSSC